MTSYTKKLYARDPKAADAFHQAQQFEHRLTYGKHVTLACFTAASHNLPAKGFTRPDVGQAPFGKRETPPSAAHACKQVCGHPACSQGCVLWVNHDPVKHPEQDATTLAQRRQAFLG